LRLFARHFSEPDLTKRSIAVAGVLLPVTYIDFGLTQVFLSHNSGVMMYAFWLAVLWGVHQSQHRTGVVAPANGT
jgi:O-antigen ligase